VIGPILFNQFALVYLAMAIVPAAAFVLYQTPWGLNLRAVGENPHAAYSAGVSVTAMRYQALLVSGALMGLAGAFLCMAQYNAYTFGVISGRGWVCIALIVFGQWSPWKKRQWRHIVRLYRCPAAAPAGEQRDQPALPGVPDAAVRAHHRGDGSRVPQCAGAGRPAQTIS